MSNHSEMVNVECNRLMLFRLVLMITRKHLQKIYGYAKERSTFISDSMLNGNIHFPGIFHNSFTKVKCKMID